MGEVGRETVSHDARSDARARKRRLAVLAGVCVFVIAAAILGLSLSHHDPVSVKDRSLGTLPTSSSATTPASAHVAGAPTTEQPSAPGPTTTRPPVSRVGPSSFTMLFAGDLLPHGPVNRLAAQYGHATGQAYDYDPLLAAMKPLVSSADLALCHMETPVAPDQGRITTYPVFGAPAGLVRSIKDTGYDGCSTASNHSLDKGEPGIRATVAAFQANGLGHTGTYVSANDASRIQMYDVKGVKVAHLSYAYGFNGIPIPADAPWSVHQIDASRILAEAKRAKAAGARFVVVSLHWGNEYQPAPNAEQLTVAPILAASPDIDLIVGHHVHVVQPIAREHGKFVVFGMGNQLSNQHEDLRRDGLTVLVTVDRGSAGHYVATHIRCIPTFVDAPALKVYPAAPALADPSTPAGLRNQLQASFARTMAVVNSRGPSPGVTAYEPPP